MNFQPSVTWHTWVIQDSFNIQRNVNYFGANSGVMFECKVTTGIMWAYVRATNPIAWVGKAGPALTAGKLYHLCATCYHAEEVPPPKGNKTLSNELTIDFYVNGTKYSVISTGNTGNRGINYIDTNPYLRVGKYSTSNYFDGKIEEFAVWNVRLTETEILQLWSSYKKRMPLMLQPANLQVYWTFDDNNPGIAPAGTAQDMSANARTGAYNTPASIVCRESILPGGII